MEKTPKELIVALDMITAPKPPKETIARPEMLAVHHERVRRAFDDPNIIGVGISEKVTNRRATGHLAICFYVKKKLAPKKVDAKRLIPPVIASMNSRAVFTDVKELGEIVPQKAVNRKSSPIQSGFSVANAKDTAGTLGAIVGRGAKRFLLSNSHVLARAGKAAKGEPILYPGPADKGTLKVNDVASLTQFTPFKVGSSFTNHVDAALAEVRKDRMKDINYQIEALKAPPEVITPARGMRVVKLGRTTGRTDSVIRDVHFRILVDYDGVGTVGFHDQVLCDTYTDGGDSGSLVLDKANGRIVGLHFAGSDKGSVFTPIKVVMSALRFRFVTS